MCARIWIQVGRLSAIAEFSYSNSYLASLQMAPFEFMYGRKCRTPLNWSEVGESQIFGPNILREAEEKVHKIHEHLKTAQSRQKSYADKRRRDLAFNIGDFVYLKGNAAFPTQRKVSPQIYRTFTNSKPSRRSIVSIGATQRDVSRAQCVPYLITSQVYRSPQAARR